tara:strand:+ start:269 stop:1030 length:762 start_codon:yes stop_codon:yes gene_type:complete
VLQGGLGNQMFQIAATSALAWRNNDDAIFDLSKHYLPLQGRKAFNYTNNIFRSVEFSESVHPSHIYKEPHHHYEAIPYRKDVTLFGYFQSEKHFSDYSEEVKELFSPSEATKQYINEKYGELLSGEVASIHVRRGDYLKFKNIHPTCTEEYYTQAMATLPENTNYMIFSDDPEWCLKNFSMKHFKVVEGEEDYVDMYLMSMCKNNIIANSSFSWWAAWLNKNDDKIVIAPKVWFGPDGPKGDHDLLPNNWMRI